MKDGKKHSMHEMAHHAVMRVKKINNNPLAHGQMHIDKEAARENARYKSERSVMKDKMDKGPKMDPYKP